MARKIKQSEVSAVKKERMALQGFRCPLCSKDLRTVKSINVVLDHDHTTGLVRDALCRGCNGAEGKIKRLAETYGKTSCLVFLTNLLTYWKKHKDNKSEYIYYNHKTAEEKRALRNKRARAKYAAKKETK